MQFPSILKCLLIDCLRNVFDQYTLQTFTSHNKGVLKEDFNQVLAGPGGGLADYITKYIDRLILIDTVHELVDTLRKDNTYGSVSNVASFAEQYDKFYIRENNRAVRNPGLFASMIVKEFLPFVARENIRNTLYRMSNGQPKIMVLEGKPRSGLSYIQWYFSDISNKAGCFDFCYVDLKAIKHEYAGGQLVTAAHIAQFILEYLEIYDYNTQAYKYSQFLNRLKAAFKTRTLFSLLYIDQFDVMVSNDVYELIGGLIKDLSLYNIPCYIVLGGYNKTEKWDPIAKTMTTTINIGTGSFTKQDIETFFKKTYEYLSAKYSFDFTEAEFVNQCFQIIPPHLFEVSVNESNVSEIGEKLLLWYKDFYNQLQTA